MYPTNAWILTLSISFFPRLYVSKDKSSFWPFVEAISRSLSAASSDSPLSQHTLYQHVLTYSEKVHGCSS